MIESNHRKFDAVLFDLGATLIYFNAPWSESVAAQHLVLAQELIDRGYKLDAQRFAAGFLERLNAYYIERETEFIEQSTETILRAYLAEYGYPDAPSSVLRPALDAMYAVTQKIWTLEEDALPTIRQLKDQGYRLGLISNANDDKDVETLIDLHRLRSWFDVILISAAFGRRKPDPRIFEAALRSLNASPDRAVMVGDTLGADVLGAQNSGMAGIWITRRAKSPANQAHLDTILPDATIDTLSQLPDLLYNWPSKNGHARVSGRPPVQNSS